MGKLYKQLTIEERALIQTQMGAAHQRLTEAPGIAVYFADLHSP